MKLHIKRQSMKLHISGPHHEVTLTSSRMVVDTAPHTSDEAEVSLELSPRDDEKLRSLYARARIPDAEAEARAYQETNAELVKQRDNLSADLADMEASRDRWRSRAEHVNAELDDARGAVNVLQGRLDHARANSDDQLRADRDAAVQRVNELTRGRDNYKRWWEEAQEREAEQRTLKEKYAMELSALRAKLEELANE